MSDLAVKFYTSLSFYIGHYSGHGPWTLEVCKKQKFTLSSKMAQK